jgi:hypothetical protein
MESWLNSVLLQYATGAQALKAHKALNGLVFQGPGSGTLQADLMDTEGAKEKLAEIQQAEMNAMKAEAESQMEVVQPVVVAPSEALSDVCFYTRVCL